MELKQLWDVIQRRWWLIVIPVAVALIVTLPSLKAVISPPVTYSVTINFTASQTPPSDKAQTFQDQSYIPWLASEYAVTNLASWMHTESFAHAVADELQKQANKTFDINALRGAFQPDSARSIMRLAITWPDPDDIKLIAQAAIDVLSQQNQTYFPELAAQKATVVPLDAITVAPVSAPITTRLSPLFRILVGLAVGLALAFLAEYLDPTIRDRRDAEAVGLAIVGEIPRR